MSTPGRTHSGVAGRSVSSVRGVLARAGQRALHRGAAVSRPTPAALSARPTELLTDDVDARRARSRAYRLGLPRCRDAAAAWAALGALVAVLRIADDGRRSALIGDASGTRSPFRRWARSAGFAPLALDLGAPDGHAASLDLGRGSLDVLTRLHPRDANGDDVGALLADASRLLRPSGLLVVTMPLGPLQEGGVGPAEVRGVIAQAGCLGLAAVGDLVPDDYARARAAARVARGSSYGLARLTLRRRA